MQRALAAAILAFVLIAAGQARAGVSVQLLPQTSQVVPAELCTLDVFVTTVDAESLACMECFVWYDSTSLTLMSVKEGTLFASAPYPRFFRPDVSAAPDTVSAVDCLLGYRSYFLPPGDLVRFVFRADQPGVAAVRITDIDVWDIDRNEVAVVVDPNAWIVVGTPVGIRDGPPAARPLTCYPNPFNPSTTLELRLPGDGGSEVTVAVYTASGKRVVTLFEGWLEGNVGRFDWRGCDAAGARVASGVYIAVAKTRHDFFTAKLVLIE
jgi:hypothetical protein